MDLKYYRIDVDTVGISTKINFRTIAANAAYMANSYFTTRSSDDRLSRSQPDSVMRTVCPSVIARAVFELARIMCRKKVFPASINWELPS